MRINAHAAAALLGFSHKKMRAHERKREMTHDPAKHAPTPALPQLLLLLVNAAIGTAWKPSDVVHANAAAHFMQRDLCLCVGEGNGAEWLNVRVS